MAWKELTVGPINKLFSIELIKLWLNAHLTIWDNHSPQNSAATCESREGWHSAVLNSSTWTIILTANIPWACTPSPAPTVQTTQGKHQQGPAKTYIRGLFCTTFNYMSHQGSGVVQTILSGPDNPLKDIYPIFIPLPYHLQISVFLFSSPGTACHAQVNKHK